MKVVEIFKSIDGEGKRTGEITTFIRLYGCNLNCKYCDTRYACIEEDSEVPYVEMAIEDILDKCKQLGAKNITVTGGEPLIHKDIKLLLAELSKNNYDINVETNGSVSLISYVDYTTKQLDPLYKNVWFTVDYKTSASGMTDKMESFNFRQGIRGCVYKFVVGSIEDLQEVGNVLEEFNPYSDNIIYISPVFGKIEPKQIVEYMIQNNFNKYKIPIRCQVQLHKIIWDPQERGV